MKKKWKVFLCVALAVVVLAGGVTAWLLYTPPDTDPDAPFKDLSDREKRRVLAAVEEYWESSPPSPAIYWYGDPAPGGGYRDLMHGVQYYGTFEGYHIILSSRETIGLAEQTYHYFAGGYSFSYGDPFVLLAYKNGKAIPLEEAYLNPLSKEQIQQIHQCFERYSQEIYTYREYFPNRD